MFVCVRSCLYGGWPYDDWYVVDFVVQLPSQVQTEQLFHTTFNLIIYRVCVIILYSLVLQFIHTRSIVWTTESITRPQWRRHYHHRMWSVNANNQCPSCMFCSCHFVLWYAPVRLQCHQGRIILARIIITITTKTNEVDITIIITITTIRFNLARILIWIHSFQWLVKNRQHHLYYHHHHHQRKRDQFHKLDNLDNQCQEIINSDHNHRHKRPFSHMVSVHHSLNSLPLLYCFHRQFLGYDSN